MVDVEDRPGVLADLTRKIAKAGVDLDLVYVATQNRVVFGAPDLDRAEGSDRVRRVLGTVAGVVSSLVLVAPAVAAAPPELFVRTQSWDTHEETGPWLPLASAPSFGYLGGYEIGYRRQATGFQRVALTDHRRARRDADPAVATRRRYCVGRSPAAVGDIEPAGAGAPVRGQRHVHREGLGRGRPGLH